MVGSLVGSLITDPELGCRLAEAGRESVLENITLDRMAQHIEDGLLDCFATSSKV